MRDKFTIVFSPHIDDVFLSLNAFIASGDLGSNVVGVNLMSMTNSQTDMNREGKYSFGSIRDVVSARMVEEVEYSNFLKKRHGINYVPLFPGLRDARLERLCIPKDYASAYTDAFSKSSAGEQEIVKTMIDYYKDNLDSILFPIGIKNRSHAKVRDILFRLEGRIPKRLDVGLYADIPYVERYTAKYRGRELEDTVREMVPENYRRLKKKDFDAQSKFGIFKQIYRTQFNEKMEKRLRTIPSEMIFWRE